MKRVVRDAIVFFIIISSSVSIFSSTAAAPMGSRPLELGASGQDVAELQRNLTVAGSYQGPVTGYYGQMTLNAVVAFQKEARLPAKGYVGDLTIAALKSRLKSLKPSIHTVSRGETLSVIADKYGLSTRTLIALNKLSNPNQLIIGQKIRLEPSAVSVNKTSARPAPKSVSAQPGTAKPNHSLDDPLIVFQETKAEPGKSAQPQADKVLALTFDDGPDPDLTPKVLDLLKQHGFKATFFVIGSQAEKYPDLVRKILSSGHEVASHSYNHRDLTQISLEGLVEEFVRSSDILKQISGQPPSWFRPPFGAFDERVISQASKHSQRLALWTNIGPQDIPGPILVKRVLSSAREGAIILLHDNQEITLNVLEQVLPSLKAKGFRSVTLTEMTGSLSP